MAVSNKSINAAQLDVIFDGMWVMAPSIDRSGKIIGVDIYAPACGHPQGAVFVPELAPDPWPAPTEFYQLDNHGHTLHIERANRSRTGTTLRDRGPMR